MHYKNLYIYEETGKSYYQKLIHESQNGRHLLLCNKILVYFYSEIFIS